MCVCVIDLCIAVEVKQWDCFVDKLFAELPIEVIVKLLCQSVEVRFCELVYRSCFGRLLIKCISGV